MPALVATFDNSPDREELWYKSNVAGLRPLHAGQGGPFDIVQAYKRKLTPRSKQLYIWRSRGVEVREAMGGLKGWVHDMAVDVYWSISAGTGALEDDQRALEAALAILVERIRGPFGDKTHGGNFFACGEVRDYDSNYGEIEVQVSDAYATLNTSGSLEARVRYQCLDNLFQA